jgi:hypothetical protein
VMGGEYIEFFLAVNLSPLISFKNFLSGTYALGVMPKRGEGALLSASPGIAGGRLVGLGGRRSGFVRWASAWGLRRLLRGKAC